MKRSYSEPANELQYQETEPANELQYQEMLRTASQMQKNLDALLKQCKQHSDQMPKHSTIILLKKRLQKM
jgi:hypothetical protein